MEYLKLESEPKLLPLDENSLKFYSCILHNQRFRIYFKQFQKITFQDIKYTIQQSIKQFHQGDILKNFMPIVNHSIHLTPRQEVADYLHSLIVQGDWIKTDEDLALILQFVYQILKTLSTIIEDDENIHFSEQFKDEIVNLVFHETTILKSRSIQCALVLMKDLDCLDLGTKIWLYMTKVEDYKSINTLSQLIDFFLLKQIAVMDKHLWQIIYNNFKMDATHRKQAAFILKKIIDYLSKEKQSLNVEEYFQWNHNNETDKNSWMTYLTIIDNLAEKQSHLILPSLKMMDKVNVPLLWWDHLLSQILSHKNTVVLKWIVQYVLSNQSVQELSKETLQLLLMALNNTFLYTDEFSLFSYKIFFERYYSKIINLLSTIQWKSVSLHAVLQVLAAIEGKHDDHFGQSIMLEVSASIRRIQNKVIRKYIRRLFFVIFKKEIISLSLKDYLTIIETLHNSNDNFDTEFEEILSKKIQFGNCFVSFQLLNICLKCKILELKNKLVTMFVESSPPLEELLTLLLMKDLESVLQNAVKMNIIKRFELDLDGLCSNFENIQQLMITDFKNFVLIKGSDNMSGKLRERLVDYFSNSLFMIKDRMSPSIIEMFLDKGGFITLGNVMNSISTNPNCSTQSTLNKIISDVQLQIKKIGFVLLLNIFQSLVFTVSCLDVDIFCAYVEKLLDIDPMNPFLAFTVYNKLLELELYDLRVFGEEQGTKLLVRGLIFGEPLHGDSKVEYDYRKKHSLYDDEDEVIDRIGHSSDCDTYSVRLTCLKLLFKIWNSEIPIIEKHQILNQIAKTLLNTGTELNVKRSRYFDNSKQHRIKLRVMQALAVLQSITKVYHPKIEDVIFKENNQSSVMLIAEILIADGISKERFRTLLDNIDQYSPSILSSFFEIAYMFCMRHQSIEIVEYCIKIILPYTMGQYFNARLYAQITIYHLLEKFPQVKCDILIKNCIEESLKHGNEKKHFEKLQNNFQFNNLNYSQLIDFVNILVYIPTITNMASDELYKIVELPGHNIFNSRTIIEKYENNKNIIENEDHILINDVQRKMNPIEEFTDPGLIYYSDTIQEKTFKEMIVVASLLTKPANIGGIARTCDVLGIKNLILESFKLVENKEFRSLSMTAEKWLNLSEVKSQDLREFLINKKNDGYKIVGAEQTSGSINFVNFTFPEKTILLLGQEKEGIPANYISLLDFAVEVPQFGMVRSLNVHVTGALFMWEYCKQHIVAQGSKE